MEPEFVTISYEELVTILKTALTKIQAFRQPNVNHFLQHERNQEIIEKTTKLFTNVIKVAEDLDGKIGVRQNFYDFINNLNNNKFQLENSIQIQDLCKDLYDFINEASQGFRILFANYDVQGQIQKSGEDIKLYLEEAEVNLEKIKNTTIKAEQLYTDHPLKGFKKLYADTSKQQEKFSKKWLTGAIVFAPLLLVSIFICFLINSRIWDLIIFQDNASYIFVFANEISFNLILLAASLWCARMYSINKALEINYRHKSVSSDALLSFVEAIKNDEKTKNTILLEASRMIFAPPETGLTSKNNRMDEKLLDTIRDISPVNNINLK